MGSHHPLHPYFVQTLAFIVSLILPAGLFGLLFGAAIEKGRRRGMLEAEGAPD